MEKKGLFGIFKFIKLLIIILLVIAVAVFFLFPRFTGKTVIGDYDCYDSDDGKNFDVKGITRHGEVVKGEDTCVQGNRLKEYYCLSKTSTNHYYYECPNGCKDGRCISGEDIGIGDEVGVDGIENEVVDLIDNNVGEDQLIQEKEGINIFQKIIKWIFGLKLSE